MSYEAYLREHLFEPAGMKLTGYKLPQWKHNDLAHGYIFWRDWGTPLDHLWNTDGPYWNLRANGGILSTVNDMYLWHLALTGTKVLSETSKQKLFAPYISEDKSDTSWYCYGWVRQKTPRGTTVIQHNGSNMVFYADIQRFIDEDAVIIMMANCGPIFLSKYIRKYQEDIHQIIFLDNEIDGWRWRR
jgi:CubicO group peptidase (beta-lactamase class C family)